MTRIPLSDFLGGGAAVAPTPKRMKLDEFLSGGAAPPVAAAPAPLSVPFVNQPTPADPLTELLTGGTADPDWMVSQPPAPPVQGIPAVQGVLDNYNLSGYVNPSLKAPPSFEVPDAALTPPGIRNFNERRQAEEARKAEEDRKALEEAFTPSEPADAEGQYAKMQRRAKYYETLPYKITADIQSDPATFERYRRLNELATGGPLLDVPAENRPAAQQAISETIASMKANGVDDPVRWMMEIDSFDGPQGIAGRSLSAAWEQTKRSGANMFDAMVDPMGNNTLGTRQRQMEAGWQEGVADVQDERSLLPNAVNEVARAASQSAPQLAAAAGVGYATKNPALAWATLLGPSGVENFQVGRTNGLTNAEAAGRAVALAGVEYATAKLGGKVAEKFGMQTFEEIAFGTGAKAAATGTLKPLTRAIGGSIIEGGEEVAAGVAQQFSDFVVGLEDELVGDETPEQLALAFAVGMVASGAMHLPSFANFVQNPTVENAEAAGITEELAPTQVDRESLATAAVAKMEEMAPAEPGVDQSPQPPADAIPPNAPIETPLPPEAIQEQPAPPAEPVAEPPRKRRIGERITAPPVTTLTGRSIPSPPRLRPGSGERGVTNDIRKQLQWLLDEGIAEATARGDEFNLQWMQGEKVGSLSKGNGLPPATVDSLNEYLFGETNPSWDSKTGARIDSGTELSSPPPVPAPFTKPLVPPAVDAPVQKKRIGDKKPTAEELPPAEPTQWQKPSGTSHPKADAPLTKFEQRAYDDKLKTNARIRKEGRGSGASEGRGWIADAWRRRPEWVKTPADAAEWIEGPRGGFDIGPYYKYLDQEGVTLEQAIANYRDEELARFKADKAKPAPTPPVAPPDAPPVAPSQAPADSGVALWDLSPQELDAAYDTAQDQDKNLLERLFGQEGARKYRSAQARTGSMMATRAEMEEARNVVGDMEDALTEEQRNELYGIGVPDNKNPEAIKPFRDAMARIDDSSPSALGGSVGAQLIYLKDKNDPAEMNLDGQVAYAVLQEAMNRADEKGYSREAVSKAAVQRAASMFSDPEDAVYMLDRFLPKKQAAKAEGPKRIGDNKVVPALPAPKKSIGKKKPAPVEEPLPNWVTEDDAPTAPTLDKNQKNDLNRLRRRFKQKLDKETFDELSGLSEYDQHVVAAEADRRADWANNGIQQLLDSFDGLQTHDMSQIATRIRNILRSGKKDTASIPGFDELLSDVRDNHPSLAAYAESVGNGSVESGLADILAGGRKGLEAKLVGPETEVFDVLEEYRERLERSPEEEGRGSIPETSSGGFESQGGDQEGGRRNAAEAEDFKLSREGSTDTSPIVEPYKVADKDRLPPKRKTERQPQLDGLPEDLDESVLAGQQGLQFSATTGEQLQPDKPKVIVTPPKSQREIIGDLAKTLDIPIRFGRMLHKQAGGTFFRKPNLIALKRANDVPVATHEVGHKLDAMFKLSSDKAVRSELERLGDPNTPGSRSSWTKSKSKSYKLGEGVAEYVRYWMTDPKKAKAEAPNMHTAFEAVLDANKDLGDALRQTQEDIRIWRTAEPQARLRSQISIGDNPNKTRYSLSQLTRDVVDDLHYLKLATEDAKLGAPGLKPSQNPYLLARNLRGSYGMASTFIQSGAVNFTTKDVALGTSLEDALKPVGGRLNDFRDWIVAKRAQELESQGRATGLVKSDIDAVVKAFEGDAEFEKAFADVKKWNDSVLQYSVDAGLVTTESAKAIRDMNQDYVPFHRLFEVGANEAPSNESSGQGSGLNPGKPGSLKRLKGSTRNIVDPLETMVKNAYAIITASEKSAISLAVADMAKLPNMGKWVEKVAAPMQPKTVRVDEIIDQLADLGADVEALEKSADVLTFFRQAKKPPKGENTISVVRDGKPEFYRLNRYLHDTFEALDLDDAGKLVRILSTPAQLLRAGVTLEPGFNLANMMRDTFGAAVVGKYGALPFETTLRGIGAIIAKPQLVAEWAAAGGRSSVEANYFDRKKMQKYLAERVSKDLTPAERALIVAKSPLTALRWMSTTFEEATRIGEYEKAFKSLKQSGMTDGEARRLAAFEARDRQDFAKGGAKTKILRHVAAFWNAQLQANVRLAQSFKERPLQTTLKGLAFVTLPKLLEQALNWDDEDYWNRPQWERDVFYMIPIGKDDAGHTRFLRIPVPFEIGIIFATVPGRFLEWAKKNDPEAVKGIPGMFLKQTMPVPNPSGAVTIMEMIPDQGYSYFRGREIVPDSMADMPKDLQWTQQTSTLAKKIGEATGLSPMKVDYFIESTTGGLGKVAMGKQVPGERFVSNPLAVVGQPIADFYDIRQQLTEDAERIKATGEYKGFGPVMLAEFEDAGEKMGALRNRARETENPVDKALLEDEAYRIAVKMVQRYRENPSPEESIADYATRHAERVILSSGRPHRQKRKLGSTEPVETEADYEKRLHEWETKRKIADEWLKSHKDTPAVQAAISAAEKDIPAYPQHRGDSDFTYGKRVAEWKSRYGNSARTAKGLK